MPDATAAPAIGKPSGSHGTMEERAARGKALRREVPRSSLAHFTAAAARPDPVALLVGQGASRVQELLPIRYGRMSASPFSFYRGAALVMASDLAENARTGLTAHLCGDAHLSNFGAYASPERRLVFDVNDFDETNPGPFEWDVKRLVTSFEVASRQNGFSAKDRERVVTTSAAAYRTAMARLAGLGELDFWYDQIEVEAIAAALKAQGGRKAAKEAKAVDRSISLARGHNALQALGKLTTVVDGRRRIVSNPPLIVPLAELRKGADAEAERRIIEHGLREYSQTLQSDRRELLSRFSLVDLAHKVVGVGSVGTRCWILLMGGRDDDDPLFLQFKEAGPSVLETFTTRSRYKNMGARVVAGQRVMQSSSDIFLGWVTTTDTDGHKRDYYFRQLRDWKLSAEIETLGVAAMTGYAKLCGATLAKAHARTGDRVAIASYVGADDATGKPNPFDLAMREFASAYADQNQRDFDALASAIAAGRVAATPNT